MNGHNKHSLITAGYIPAVFVDTVFTPAHPSMAGADMREGDPERGRDVEWFIAQGIARVHQARWRHLVLEHPEKSKREMHKFERHLDTRRCRQTTLPDFLQSAAGLQAANFVGTYFDGSTAPVRLSLDDALKDLPAFSPDAIFASYAERFAIFLHHDGMLWVIGERSDHESGS